MEIIKTPEIDLWYVTTQKDLETCVSILEQQDALATDTETFIDLDKYDGSALDPHSNKISLFQFNYRNNSVPYLIDAVLIDDLSILLERVLMNKSICKILHNASFDLKAMYSYFGVWIQNVMCTRTLMQSLGICTGMKASLFRGHALKDLARDYFSINLDKNEATSQWGARPLVKSQLIYSALDVGAPKGSGHTSILLEGFDLLTTELDRLNQQKVYKVDQQAIYISAKLEYEGMYIDTDILQKVADYAKDITDKNRKYLVEELGFTVYNDVDIDEETGEWIQVQVIPDKIKVLLNNNKGLVQYINEYLDSIGEKTLSSLQAEEIKNYLDTLEKEVDDPSEEEFDQEYFDNKYDSMKLIKALLQYKKYNKLMSECDKYFKIINRNTNKVHAGFNSVGTSTGRMSSSGDLNLQQVSTTQVTLQVDREQF